MKVEKIYINAKPRQLTAKWTVDLEQGDIEIGEAAAKILQEEIDWEVMCDLMKSMGWKVVELNWSHTTEDNAHEIKEWCRKNLKGHYKARGRTWIFENEQDANWFSLRWSYA